MRGSGPKREAAVPNAATNAGLGVSHPSQSMIVVTFVELYTSTEQLIPQPCVVLTAVHIDQIALGRAWHRDDIRYLAHAKATPLQHA